MSQENVETVGRAMKLLRGDVDAWLELMDPDIGWDISTHPLPDVPNQGQARRPDGGHDRLPERMDRLPRRN